MRSLGLVAFAAAMAISNVAHAAGALQEPVGLFDEGESAGAFLTIVGQPGFRLSHSFRLRIESADRIDAVAHGVSPLRTSLIDIGRRRRLSSMLDYYPMRDSGFHLSAGMRRSPKRARFTPGSASNVSSNFDIFMPTMGAPLRVKTNVARSSPTVMAGWSGLIAPEASLGFSAGAVQEHGGSMKTSTAMIARSITPAGAWSRVGEVAQVNFAMRF